MGRRLRGEHDQEIISMKLITAAGALSFARLSASGVPTRACDGPGDKRIQAIAAADVAAET